MELFLIVSGVAIGIGVTWYYFALYLFISNGLYKGTKSDFKMDLITFYGWYREIKDHYNKLKE